jgi:hypothetical protein
MQPPLNDGGQVVDIQVLPIACRPFDPAWVVHSLGNMNILCPFCHALHWDDERLAHSTVISPKFGMCCYQGTISLPPLQPPPKELADLLTQQNSVARKFRKLIRNYNNALAMTSVGRKLDNTVNDGRGPYTFKLHGELFHRAGSLLPPEG